MTEVSYTAEQLQAAYVEGFCDGQDHGNIAYKYPPLSVAFIESETRRVLSRTKPIQEIHHELSRAWHAMKYSDRNQMGSPPFDAVAVVK